MGHIKNFNEYLNKNFWEWFGKSVIVDKNGNPKVCYHGTPRKFDTFRTDLIGSGNDPGYYGKGFYFTHDEKYGEFEASYYGDVMKVFLKVEKPFYYDDLLNYEGVNIGLMFAQSYVFLYNIAKIFPNISNDIFINKVTWKNEEGIIEKIPISVLPGLVNKYKKDLVYTSGESSYGDKYVSAYSKSNSILRKEDNGYEWLEYEELGNYKTKLNKKELEFSLICDAIEKHEGIEIKYLPEGLMTRNPIITEEIKKKYDGIIAGDEIIVFNPNQIKSATNNNGNFSRKSNNIFENYSR
jgi:hypothetical protein